MATVSYEHPSRLGPLLVFTSRYDAFMERPNRLGVMDSGDGRASEFYCDGKTVMAYVPSDNFAAVADAAPTIESALKQVFQKAAIFFPFTDPLLPDPYAALADA